MTMELWKYYLLDDGNGHPYEIYRLRDSGKTFYEARREAGAIYLARHGGEWSNDNADTRGFVNASTCGDFDPDDGEITEEEALTYLADWRQNGRWPGRP
jgi:hypothetical protein